MGEKLGELKKKGQGKERDETSVGEGPAGQSTPASQKRASESSKDEQRPPRVHDGC